MIAKLYRGFSTRNYAKSGGAFDLYNVELIQEDLMNELFTLRGERIREPEFGTRIPIMVMEPNDQETLDILKEDVTRSISHDPRVRLEALDVLADVDGHQAVLVAKVSYLEFNVTRDLYITINSR